MFTESNLFNHANRELELAGLFDSDADYGGKLAHHVLDLLETFHGGNHSGMSAAMAIELFSQLAGFKPLTPLTDEPDHWVEVGEGLWQSVRRSDAFSDDGGVTYLITGEETLHTSYSASQAIAALGSNGDGPEL